MNRNSNRGDSARQEDDRSENAKNMDLKDSDRDTQRLKADETTIDLPEVRDIPGQEHVHVAPLGELADTTASSDDEEGVGILDDLNEEDDAEIRSGIDSDITPNERVMLETADNFHTSEDEVRLKQASLDNRDFEGDQLNEASFGDEQSGSDLDIPGSETDDINENLGEEDEENNSYSIGSDSNDQDVEGTP